MDESIVADNLACQRPDPQRIPVRAISQSQKNEGWNSPLS